MFPVDFLGIHVGSIGGSADEGGMEDGASFGWCKEVDLENRTSIIPVFHI